MAHYNVLFPEEVGLNASYGPRRRTQVIALGSGDEERNQQWANSRRSYNAGYGIKTANDLAAATSFWEGARGKLHTFLWKDWSDWKSCGPNGEPGAEDQSLGVGDGTNPTFQLIKVYGASLQSWVRTITKPMAGSVLVAVDGSLKVETTDYTIDYATGVITFQPASIPEIGDLVTAGFTFAVKVRFDTDSLDTVLQQADFGDIPSIPIVEVF